VEIVTATTSRVESALEVRGSVELTDVTKRFGTMTAVEGRKHTGEPGVLL
jgi:hypothetical protein